MVKLSNDLMWSLTRGSQNAFVVKNRNKTGAAFTKDPLNLTNKNTAAASGLANADAVGVLATEDGNSVLMVKADGGKVAKTKLKTFGRGTARENKKVLAATDNKHFRTDLTAKALARVTRQARTARNKSKGLTYNPKTRSTK